MSEEDDFLYERTNGEVDIIKIIETTKIVHVEKQQK